MYHKRNNTTDVACLVCVLHEIKGVVTQMIRYKYHTCRLYKEYILVLFTVRVQYGLGESNIIVYRYKYAQSGRYCCNSLLLTGRKCARALFCIQAPDGSAAGGRSCSMTNIVLVLATCMWVLLYRLFHNGMRCVFARSCI